MHSGRFAAEIAHAVSSKKRIEILARAKVMGVKVTNAGAKLVHSSASPAGLDSEGRKGKRRASFGIWSRRRQFGRTRVDGLVLGRAEERRDARGGSAGISVVLTLLLFCSFVAKPGSGPRSKEDDWTKHLGLLLSFTLYVTSNEQPTASFSRAERVLGV